MIALLVIPTRSGARAGFVKTKNSIKFGGCVFTPFFLFLRPEPEPKRVGVGPNRNPKFLEIFFELFSRFTPHE